MRLPEPRKYLSAMPSENPAERENKKEPTQGVTAFARSLMYVISLDMVAPSRSSAISARATG